VLDSSELVELAAQSATRLLARRATARLVRAGAAEVRWRDHRVARLA